MKKLLTVLLICLPLCFVNAGGKQQAPAKTGTFKVLLISNLEGDKSFADSAILGAKKAIADFGVEIS
jgi:basic membrane lipoprotein Med (substrate-binding protein (PBP1-ABC) superfamily)